MNIKTTVVRAENRENKKGNHQNGSYFFIIIIYYNVTTVHRVNTKGFYPLLYSTALRTILLLLLEYPIY